MPQPYSSPSPQASGVIRLSIATPKYPDAHVLIDEVDLELVSQFPWHARGGDQSRTLYAVTSTGNGSNRHFARMHRLIMGVNHYPDVHVDHVNGDGLDNRRVNLRICTPSQNSVNRTRLLKNTSSQYRGVHWHKGGERWVARIGVRGCQHYLGSFVDEVEAARAYDEAAIRHFGEFARPNFDRSNT